jgi:hypothetical protein
VIGKLGELLNADVGVIVKGAGKMLNTDVGTVAKGAGKMLNADVGDIMKGAGRVLKTDLGDLLRGPAKDGAGGADAVAPTVAPEAPAPAAESAPPATPQGPITITPTAPPAGTPPAGAKLTEDSVTRSKRPMPAGTDLAVLLPTQAGVFERPATSPVGTIATDPVNATYTCGDETLIMRVTLCWDADEAKERLMEVKSYTAEGRRMTPEGTWILGVAEGGVVFAWTRDCYFFLALSPRGTSSLARFLAGFPF